MVQRDWLILLVVVSWLGCGGRTSLDEGTWSAAGRSPNAYAGAAGAAAHAGNDAGSQNGPGGSGASAAPNSSGGVSSATGGSAWATGGATTAVGGVPVPATGGVLEATGGVRADPPVTTAGYTGSAGTGAISGAGAGSGPFGGAGGAGGVPDTGGAGGWTGGGAVAGAGAAGSPLVPEWTPIQGECQGVQPGTIWYVDCSVDPERDAEGTSWEDALPHPMAASRRSAPCDAIWIRSSTCLPLALNEPVFAPSVSVSVYGGFSGSEASINERDGSTGPTVFEGDLVGDDVPGDALSYEDNSAHVVLVESAISVSLEGLTIRGGHAINSTSGSGEEAPPWLSGGGILATDAATVLLDKVTTVGNEAVYGAGLAVLGAESHGSAEECQFVDNLARSQGAGAFVESGQLYLSNSWFTDGEAPYGGGVFGIDAQGLLEECFFIQNEAYGSGGGLAIEGGAWDIERSRFVGNTASTGGAILVDAAVLTLTEGLIAFNTASGEGAGLHSTLNGGTVRVERAALVGNNPGSGSYGAAGAIRFGPGTLELRGTSIVGNRSIFSGAILSEAALTIVDSEIRSNSSTSRAGALGLQGGNSVVVNSAFSWNSASIEGSVAWFGPGTTHLWVNVSVVENQSAGSPDRAILVDPEARLQLDNSLLFAEGLAGETFFSGEELSGLTASNNCSSDLKHPGIRSVPLDGNPFTGEPLVGDFFQASSSPCQDAGANEAAANVEFDWTSSTTLDTLEPDAAPVDAGYHHAPEEVRIEAFVVDGTSVSWSAVNAFVCVVGSSSSNDFTVLDPAPVGASSLDHNSPSRASIALVCWDSSRRPKSRWAVVP